VNLLEDLFSGPSSPPIPRKLMHKRHPLYGQILGVDGGVIPTEDSDGSPQFCGDPENCNRPPLQKTVTPEARKAPSTPSPNVDSKYQACLSKHLYTGKNETVIPICYLGGALCIGTLGDPIVCPVPAMSCMALVGIQQCCKQIARGGSSICLKLIEGP
jgi:hypothetical protein